MVLTGSLIGCGGSSVNDGAGAPVGQPASAYADTSGSHAVVASMADALSSESSAGNSTYKIGALDVVEVTVFQVPDLSKTMQVSEAGTINYPLIGEVYVAGKSAREVEQSLTRSLGAKYLKDPQVTVFVREHNSQRVTVQGSVTKPGIYPIQGQMTLLQLMALAGGLDSVSDDTVVVFRTAGGQKSAARFNVSQVQSGSAPDPQLQAGDIVVAGKSYFKEGFNNALKALPLATVFTLL